MTVRCYLDSAGRWGHGSVAAFSIYFTSLLGGGVAAAQSAREAAEIDAQQNRRERSGGEGVKGTRRTLWYRERYLTTTTTTKKARLMPRIVPAITCLEHHLKTLTEEPEAYRPANCPGCGLSGLWAHGCYERKADRKTGKLNPVAVARFLCGRKTGCGRSCSSLPSALPPRRWHLWSVQAVALLSLLCGASIRGCAVLCGRARSTVRRWGSWLEERHELFAFHLRSHWPEWGRSSPWQEFWQRCLREQPLGESMAWLDRQGVVVP